MPRKPTKEELLAALVELMSEKDEERSRYYDQDSAPLPKRTFLRIVRDGKVRGFKEGQTVLVLREELHDYLERNCRVVPKKREDEGPEEQSAPKLNLVSRVAGI